MQIGDEEVTDWNRVIEVDKNAGAVVSYKQTR